MSIETAVRDGALTPGEVLPTVRALAAELGVATGTVASAYRALRDRGVVEAAGRRGTRVRARPAVVGVRGQATLPVPAGAVDLASGQPDPALLPALGPVLARLPGGAAASPIAPGLPRLLELGRERLDRDGVPTDALTVTAGALDAVERALSVQLRPGDVVAVEDPGWPNLLDLIAGLGLRATPMGLDQEGPRPEELARALSKGTRAVVVTSRAQNPTGAALTRERAQALRRLLSEHPATLVVEDDHAAELAGIDLASLAGATSAWVFVRSVSKPYGPDLRVALCAGDPTTIGRLEGRLRLGPGWVSSLLQHLVAQLWSDPEVDRVIGAAARSYDQLRGGLLAELAARGVTARGRTGINVWVAVPDETVAVTRLLAAGWVVAPGARFRLASPPAVRVTVSGLAAEDLSRLADSLAQAVAPGARPAYPA